MKLTTTTHPRRWGAATATVVVLALVALAATMFAGSPGRGARSADADHVNGVQAQLASKTTAYDVPADGPSMQVPVRMVQANIKSGMDDAKVASDLSLVFGQAPDFVTFNEVPFRADAVLAPPGYQLFRTPGQYTGANPVVWNAAKWTSVASGTAMISDSLAKDATQNSYWGLRYANWVTLKDAVGHVVSVIAVHIAPETDATMGLLEPSVRRVGDLANQLNAQGPVLVGGDFNVGYNDQTRYPRALLAEYALTPTYDILGTSMPTGDHFGATIDYIMLRRADQFQVVSHYATELESDHDAVTADLVLNGTQSGLFKSGVVRSRPGATRANVMKTVTRAVDFTPPGATIHLVSTSIGGGPLRAALQRAYARGVHVQVLTGRPRSQVMKALIKSLRTNVRSDSWACACLRASVKSPQARVLISITGGTPGLRVDIDRPLVPRSKKGPMKATLRTTQRAYDVGFKRFFRAVGR